MYKLICLAAEFSYRNLLVNSHGYYKFQVEIDVATDFYIKIVREV